ncbi:uncharacterized protein HKW66_Vig0105670 [Vigna angularis]|uniref:Band 7 domain-containing protein n=1 Tax=Phaseolus angularis TaxID=3914 RepID=A0A8T0KHY3_PHAAN|nr:uncharacterized protein HKW66_Vig0105670 [Vigna angularis]
MATIWKTNSARNAVRFLSQSLASTSRTPSIPPRFSSVRYLRTGRDPSSRTYDIIPPIVDPKLASYGVENPIYAVIQLAQTTMRSELGKITLDKTFEERDTLNEKIVEAINVAAKSWGLECLRYEIRDISPPRGVRAAMEMQAEAERKKRAQILESEGERQAHINIADGKKSSVILASEAARMDQVNRAQGEAEAILSKAKATAEGLARVSTALKENGGPEAASLRIAEQYIQAFSNIAKEGTTMLLPSSASNPANMMAQALTMYKSLLGNVSNDNKQNGNMPLSISGKLEVNDASGEIKDKSSTTANESNDIQDYSEKSRFPFPRPPRFPFPSPE